MLQRLFSKKMFLLATIAGFIVIIVYVYVNSSKQEDTQQNPPAGANIPVSTPVSGGTVGVGQGVNVNAPVPFSVPVPESTVYDGWSKYDSNQEVSFKYPSNATITETNIGTTVSIAGQGAIESSEHYDSLYLLINKYNLNERDLLDIVKTKVSNYAGSESSVIGGINELKVGDKQGYYFRSDQYLYIYLVQGDEYITIVDGTPVGNPLEATAAQIIYSLE